MHSNLTYNRQAFSLISTLGLVILIIGTGLYEADPMPKDEILVSCSSVILLLCVYAYCQKTIFIDTRVLLGFILFNCFFTLRLLFSTTHEVETKAFFTHFISLGIFVAVYSASIQILSNKETKFIRNYSSSLVLVIFSITALLILLSTQVAQFHSDINILNFRPGGYLNPNTTAVIALLFTFSVTKLTHIGAYQLIAIILAICIISLSQSRSALLAFIPFLVYIFIKDYTKKFILIAVVLTIFLLIALASLPELREFLSNFLRRFENDLSSGIRLSLLKSGWISFTEAPIWGNSYKYVASITGNSTHNEIIETLANFGLIGLLIISIAGFLLYFPFSVIFFIVCIAPTLLFTHNFFDAYAYQAMLGLALASERNKSFLSKAEP